MLTDIQASSSFGPVEAIRKQLHQTKNVMKCVYDFSKLGGAIGAIKLVDDYGVPAKLPKSALVVRTYLDVLTPVASLGAATVSVDSKGAGDLLAATAKASLTGFVDGKCNAAAANMVKMTAETQVTATVAVAALTAGKFNVFIEYVIGD